MSRNFTISVQSAAKRLLDILFAVLALILLSPVLALMAVLIRLQSPGPAIYRGERMGRDGRPFWILKFRTMVDRGADNAKDNIAAPNDSRITKIGAVLRRYKLDELPQFINVLRGEMSIVGPRPESPRYLPWYTTAQKQIFQVRPGITGLSQIYYVDETAHLARAQDHERMYVEQILPHKLRMDLEYTRQYSVYGDLKIIVLTCLTVVQSLFGKNKALAPVSLPERASSD